VCFIFGKIPEVKLLIDYFIINSSRVLGNHDKPRVGSRYGTERIDGMLMLLLLLPGVAVTYNGDEIGMLDYRYGISWEDTVDPQV
jgi:alpha-glucosidase